mmetsp:Transcript_78279/g.108792  ORF Transcript_78279/g.108792 Transcript_78279/m.108792 type:complete len:210 (-) Transcript_78279:423-1052(-)
MQRNPPCSLVSPALRTFSTSCRTWLRRLRMGGLWPRSMHLAMRCMTLPWRKRAASASSRKRSLTNSRRRCSRRTRGIRQLRFWSRSGRVWVVTNPAYGRRTWSTCTASTALWRASDAKSSLRRRKREAATRRPLSAFRARACGPSSSSKAAFIASSGCRQPKEPAVSTHRQPRWPSCPRSKKQTLWMRRRSSRRSSFNIVARAARVVRT